MLQNNGLSEEGPALFSMRNGPRRSVVAVLLAIALLGVPPAWAVDLGEWVPGLKATFSITERGEYESNVFQTRSDAVDDIVVRTVPGLLIDYGQGPLTASAAYRAEILKWLDIENQDNVHHIGVGQIKLELPRLMATIRDDLTRTSDPPPTGELTGRIESLTNVFAPTVEYKLTARMAVGANWAWTHVNYENRARELDRNEHLWGGSLFWKVFPKADVSLGYNYGIKRFTHSSQESKDSNRRQILGGLRGDLTEKLSSTFRVGYELREAEGTATKDATALVFGGDVTYKIAERTRISLSPSRSYEESVFGGTSPGLFFRSTSASAVLDHQFNPKLSANLRVSGTEHEYATKEPNPQHPGRFQHRNDTIWGWGGGVDYEIQKWLQLGAEYSHARRDSNFISNSYKDDKITGKVTFQF